MNYITKYELDNKELASKFSIENGNLVFDENSKFKEDFQVGDIIVSKNNTDKIGLVSSVEDDELSINWSDNSESLETSDNLIIIPPTLGLQLIKNNDLLESLNLKDEYSKNYVNCYKSKMNLCYNKRLNIDEKYEKELNKILMSKKVFNRLRGK